MSAVGPVRPFLVAPVLGSAGGSLAGKADGGEEELGLQAEVWTGCTRPRREDLNSRLCKAGKQALEIVSNGSWLMIPIPTRYG